MKRKCAFTQNYFIDSIIIDDVGTQIYNAMIKADEIVEEAQEVLGEILSLISQVPQKVRCGELMDICAMIRAEISVVNYMSYGKKVYSSIVELANYSEYFSMKFVKKMDENVARLRSLSMESKSLSAMLMCSRENMNSNMQLTEAQQLKMDRSLKEMKGIYNQEIDYVSDRFSLMYQAAKYAGVQVSSNGGPIINNGTDAKRYMDIMNLSLHGGTLEIVNTDGSRTTFYTCGRAYEEAVKIQMNLSNEPQIYSNGRWKSASRVDVFEAMLPYNHMERDERYQFIDLSYDKNFMVENAQKILENEGILEGKERAFFEAARRYNISPIYLIAHSVLETGHGTSELACGYSYNGKTVYNVYGYGAYDGNAVESGAEVAYNNEWFSLEEAIIGGAEKISENYMGSEENSQSTLYEMRWNPQNPGQHQYATDVKWALTQVNAMELDKIYDTMPCEQLHFYIPVYGKK